MHNRIESLDIKSNELIDVENSISQPHMDGGTIISHRNAIFNLP